MVTLIYYVYACFLAITYCLHDLELQLVCTFCVQRHNECGAIIMMCFGVYTLGFYR